MTLLILIILLLDYWKKLSRFKVARVNSMLYHLTIKLKMPLALFEDHYSLSLFSTPDAYPVAQHGLNWSDLFTFHYGAQLIQLLRILQGAKVNLKRTNIYLYLSWFWVLNHKTSFGHFLDSSGLDQDKKFWFSLNTASVEARV